MIEQITPHPIHLKDYTVPAYLIEAVDLTFDLQEEETLVKSLLKIQRNPASTQNDAHLILHGEELILQSIKQDDQPLTKERYEVTAKSLTVFNVPEKFILEISVKIFPQKNTALSGLYRSGNTYCTQCEAEGFRRITYFLDRPDVLSRFTTTIIAKEARYPSLLSNGNLIDSGRLSSGKHFAKWEDPFKKPSYLFALVAGDFDVIQGRFTTLSQREISLFIYVEKGYGDQASHALYCLQQAMRWDEHAYGREYDLDIYMIVAIGDFNMGAMENKGLNIFNTKYVLAKPETATDDDYIHILSVIGHEYFHNWSGNRVTCRDWFQLSLKEGLTIFRDQSFSEDTLSAGVMRIHDVMALRETQFPEDAGPLAHPVRPESYIEINNFYTATIYNKGAEVLRMLQTILGKPLFRKAMDLYFSRYDGQATTIENYVQCMEETAGISLAQFRLWYTQAGTPEVKVVTSYDAKQQTYTMTLTQSCPPTPDQPSKQAFLIPIRLSLLDSEGKEIPLHLAGQAVGHETVLSFNQPQQTFHFTKISTSPIPSLLRNFSAPIKLHYSYSNAELQFLLQHDHDPFNRWEAGQSYFLRILLELIRKVQSKQPLQLPIDCSRMIAMILQNPDIDDFLAAEMLTLPSEKYIGEQMPVIDVDAIHAAREFMQQEIATKLQDIFLSKYHERQAFSVPQFDIKEIGHRRLKKICLAYLMTLPQFAELGMSQFSASLTTNMTDTLSALVGLSHLNTPLRDQALDLFYTTWRQDALVIDKWLAIQAASKRADTLAQVKQLISHPAFDLKNPNKVYALIGTFGRNAVSLHQKSGEAYVFLREIVSHLDKLNPQVAARMVNPLTHWKRYDKERQQLMRKQLELILQDQKISTDLYELITKSLE